MPATPPEPDERAARPPARENAAQPTAPGIPDVPAGDPVPSGAVSDVDEGVAPGPTPARDFWEALYTRRSIRKFKPDAVPRELVTQVLHAGMWAPSSCNYQMWDFVAVDDPAVNAKLAGLSLQMGNAPVNVVVAYGRDFSEEGWANVQSASAAIQNMSLAAHVLGLGTFWITQMGDGERVREVVGLPEDRLVVAVLALGWPKVVPKKGPKRRPLRHVAHFNHYAGRPIPSSTRPADWPADLLAVYQRARVLNGLRHNKPRPWEVDALVAALAELVPEGRGELAPGEERPRWLDVLPCTGIVTERLYRERPKFRFDVVERSREVGEFVAQRVVPHAGIYGLPGDASGLPEPAPGAYDVVSCLYRLENVPRDAREELVKALARWVKPGGKILLGHVSRRSFHDLTEWLRERRGGPGGVEYVLAPDPNVGPFESLHPGEVAALVERAGLSPAARLGLQPVPTRAEIEFRTRNFSRRHRRLAATIAWILAQLGRTPGLAARRGRFQYVLLTRKG